ncbi:MAG: CopG family transcriptional regulator [Actinomycetota bacterium]
MRTTVTFDDDVAAAIERIRHERSIGVSEAVNDLVRAGLTSGRKPGEFHQTTWDLGLKIDVTNVAEALEELEGPDFG